MTFRSPSPSHGHITDSFPGSACFLVGALRAGGYVLLDPAPRREPTSPAPNSGARKHSDLPLLLQNEYFVT